MSRRWGWVCAVAAAVVLAGLIRGGLLERSSIWVDEAFSLAMATGHSLEHPADLADPARGDFTQGDAPRTPADLNQYLQGTDPPASPGDVMRAVSMSDTSPPLYYLLLSGWTRAMGTSDAALRGFSLLCSLLSLPLIARLAWRCGGSGAVGPALLLSVFNPLWTYYAAEGRMYTLLLLLIVAQGELTCGLRPQDNKRPRGRAASLWVGWVLCAAVGMLTHYFFAFPLASMTLWLLLRPRYRWQPLAASLAVGLLILPWYWQLPEALGAWRVTAGWLEMRPGNYSAKWVPWRLFWSYFTSSGLWGWPGKSEWVVYAATAAMGALLLGTWRRRAVTGERALLWLWLLASVTGPLVFDLWRGTYAGAIMRYGMGGLPAALLLAAIATAKLRPRLRYAVAALLIAGWVVPLQRIHQLDGRCGEPYARAAHYIDKHADDQTVVIIHSIPSGVVSLTRYMDSDTPVYPWVGQLDQRQTPRDALQLTRDYRQIIFIDAHAVGEPAPEEAVFNDALEIKNSGRLEDIRLIHYQRPTVGGATDADRAGASP